MAEKSDIFWMALAAVVVAFISWMAWSAVEPELLIAARATSAGSAAQVRAPAQVSCQNAPQCTIDSQDCNPTSDTILSGRLCYDVPAAPEAISQLKTDIKAWVDQHSATGEISESNIQVCPCMGSGNTNMSQYDFTIEGFTIEGYDIDIPSLEASCQSHDQNNPFKLNIRNIEYLPTNCSISTQGYLGGGQTAPTGDERYIGTSFSIKSGQEQVFHKDLPLFTCNEDEQYYPVKGCLAYSGTGGSCGLPGNTVAAGRAGAGGLCSSLNFGANPDPDDCPEGCEYVPGERTRTFTGQRGSYNNEVVVGEHLTESAWTRRCEGTLISPDEGSQTSPVAYYNEADNATTYLLAGCAEHCSWPGGTFGEFEPGANLRTLNGYTLTIADPERTDANIFGPTPRDSLPILKGDWDESHGGANIFDVSCDAGHISVAERIVSSQPLEQPRIVSCDQASDGAFKLAGCENPCTPKTSQVNICRPSPEAEPTVSAKCGFELKWSECNEDQDCIASSINAPNAFEFTINDVKVNPADSRIYSEFQSLGGDIIYPVECVDTHYSPPETPPTAQRGTCTTAGGEYIVNGCWPKCKPPDDDATGLNFGNYIAVWKNPRVADSPLQHLDPADGPYTRLGQAAYDRGEGNLVDQNLTPTDPNSDEAQDFNASMICAPSFHVHPVGGDIVEESCDPPHLQREQDPPERPDGATHYRLAGCFPVCNEDTEECINIITYNDDFLDLTEDQLLQPSFQSDIIAQVTAQQPGLSSGDLSADNISFIRKHRSKGQDVIEYQIKCRSGECNLIDETSGEGAAAQDPVPFQVGGVAFIYGFTSASGFGFELKSGSSGSVPLSDHNNLQVRLLEQQGSRWKVELQNGDQFLFSVNNLCPRMPIEGRCG